MASPCSNVDSPTSSTGESIDETITPNTLNMTRMRIKLRPEYCTYTQVVNKWILYNKKLVCSYKFLLYGVHDSMFIKINRNSVADLVIDSDNVEFFRDALTELKDWYKQISFIEIDMKNTQEYGDSKTITKVLTKYRPEDTDIASTAEQIHNIVNVNVTIRTIKPIKHANELGLNLKSLYGRICKYISEYQGIILDEQKTHIVFYPLLE